MLSSLSPAAFLFGVLKIVLEGATFDVLPKVNELEFVAVLENIDAAEFCDCPKGKPVFTAPKGLGGV